jgi:hypothetical protein
MFLKAELKIWISALPRCPAWWHAFAILIIFIYFFSKYNEQKHRPVSQNMSVLI